MSAVGTRGPRPTWGARRRTPGRAPPAARSARTAPLPAAPAAPRATTCSAAYRDERWRHRRRKELASTGVGREWRKVGEQCVATHRSREGSVVAKAPHPPRQPAAASPPHHSGRHLPAPAGVSCVTKLPLNSSWRLQRWDPCRRCCRCCSSCRTVADQHVDRPLLLVK